MSGWVRLTVAMCVLSGLLYALPATATDGRITFSGAVVVPTCVARSEFVEAMAGNVPSEGSFICGVQSQATVPADASTYRLSVVDLDGATMAGNQLLQYYAGYRASMHAADAQMVTRTYE
ncbi:MAG: hypothetical protein ABIQ36_14240 [Rhodanobacter sp.]